MIIKGKEIIRYYSLMVLLEMIWFNSVLALGVADKSLGDTSDIISDSSGVGTANSDTNCSISMPGTTVVCIESYTSTENGHLSIREGDIIEGKL